MDPLFNQQLRANRITTTTNVTADVPCRRWCDLSADLLIVWKLGRIAEYLSERPEVVV